MIGRGRLPRTSPALMFAALLFIAAGDATSQEQMSETVRAALAERDAVIENLLRRIEELEARVAVVDSSADPIPGHGPPPGVPGEGLVATQNGRGTASNGTDLSAEEAAEADRALERTLVATGALLLPLGQVEFEPAFQYARRTDEFPVVIGSNDMPTLAERERRRNEFTGALALRTGLPWDSQFELSLPFDYVDQSFVVREGQTPRGTEDTSGSGFGDLRIGLAKTFLREDGWVPDLIGRVVWDTGTGKRSDGGVFLGNGFDEIEGSLTALKRQDPLAFVGATSYTASFEKDNVTPGNELAFSIAALLAASPSTSLRIALDQSFVDEVSLAGSEVAGSNQVAASLQLGASSVLWDGILLNLNTSVGLTQDAPDYTVGVSLPIRFNTPLGR